MAITFVNDLRLSEMGTGDNSGTWGNVTNTNLELIGQALGHGTRVIANASSDNITMSEGTADDDRALYLKLTGGGQACTVTLLPATMSKVWIMENGTAAALTFTQGSGANVVIPAGDTKVIACTGGAGTAQIVYDVFTDLNLAGTTVVDDLTVTDVLTVTGGALLNGTTPTLTIGDAGAEDAKIVFDGNAADYHVGLDDSEDALQIGLGAALGTTPRITIRAAEVAVNDLGIDLDFRVESNNDANAFFVEGSTGNIGIGIAAPAGDFHLTDAADIRILFTSDQTGNTSGDGTFIGLTDGGNFNIFNREATNIKMYTSGVERLNIAADGAISTTTAGTSNTRLGVNAGDALDADTDFNVLIGDEAGTDLNSGDGNVGVGYKALHEANSGSNNVAVGTNAMRDLTTGTLNVAVGENAMFNGIVTGNSNIAMGYLPLQGLTGGIGNIAIGRAALGTLTSGNNSVAIGYEALNVNNNSEITSVGNFSGSVSTGAEQVFVGYSAGKFVTTGASQTFVGHNAGKGITGAKLTASNNTAIGKSAGLLLQGAAADNTLVGKGSGQAITTGKRNSFLGTNSGVSYTTGEDSVAIGNDAAKFATTAHSSVFIGADAGQGITGTKLTGNQNVCVGAQAGLKLQGAAANNTLTGFGAGKAITTGSGNSFLGLNAGSLITTGDTGVIIGGYDGNSAGLDFRTQDNYMVLSDGAGTVKAFFRADGGFCPFVGGEGFVGGLTAAVMPYSDDLDNIRIYQQDAAGSSRSLIAGFSASSTTGQGNLVLNITSNGNLTNTNNSYGAISDVKYKENIADASSQWDDIKALTVRKYSMKADELDAPNRIGVIAQELEAVGLNGLVEEQADKTGNKEEGIEDGTHKTVKYSVLYMKAIKALQEAMARIETLETKVAALEG